MPRKTLNKERRQAIREARKMILDVVKMDGNEAETRRRVERIFESLMGYKAFKHLSRERAIRASGVREHVDFAIQLDPSPDAKIEIIVELKRAGIDLAPKHLKQATSYAIDYGCEWVLLTNGKEWRLYHIEFGQPPKTRLLEQWDLLNDEPAELDQKFELISYRNVKKDNLQSLWQRAKVLRPTSLLGAIVSEDSLKLLRRIFKKTEGVNVAYADIVEALAKLLNEASAKDLENVRICIPQRKKRASTQPVGLSTSDQPGNRPSSGENASEKTPVEG